MELATILGDGPLVLANLHLSFLLFQNAGQDVICSFLEVGLVPREHLISLVCELLIIQVVKCWHIY